MSATGVRVRRPVAGPRDRGAHSVLWGFFALMWFGWAQADPPHDLVAPLYAATAIAAALALAGLALLARHRDGASMPALQDPAVVTRYRMMLAAEIVAAGGGAGVALATGHSEWVPVWIAFVVGAHLIPLSTMIGRRELVALGGAVMVAAAVAAVVGVATSVTPGAVAGGLTGLLLTFEAAASLLR